MRIAILDLDDVDDRSGQSPALRQRIAYLRPRLVRLRTDAPCLAAELGMP